MATHPGIKTWATFATTTHFSRTIMLKRSPVKSLSVRDGKDGKRSLHVKRGEKNYESVANFFFEVIGFVRCPSEFQRMNGYLLEVTRSSDGITMWVLKKLFKLLIYSFSEKPSFGVACQWNYWANGITPRGTRKSVLRKLRPTSDKIW